MNPGDLASVECEEILERLFGRSVDPEGWLSLERISDSSFRLIDRRLGLELTVSDGFLVGLHEVSTYRHASEFAGRNRIRILQDRGLFLRGTAEIAIKCDGVPPVMVPGKERFRIEYADGVGASIAHASFLFQRLVALPSAEINSTLPDPGVLTTLVMTGVDIDNVTDVAERSLFTLRDAFSETTFEFVHLTSQNVLGDSSEGASDQQETISTSFATSHPWAVAFFNRAAESEPLSSFLYYYRVLEACFDSVIETRLNAWRQDTHLDATGLLKEVRSIARTEDTFALRQVLGQIVDQAMLDNALRDGIIETASVDDLTTKIYLRRNEIAHGRRGQHQKVLVPYSFPLNESAEREVRWQVLIRNLAQRAIEKWLES